MFAITTALGTGVLALPPAPPPVHHVAHPAGECKVTLHITVDRDGQEFLNVGGWCDGRPPTAALVSRLVAPLTATPRR